VSDWREIKRLQSKDGLRRLFIEAEPQGLFRFSEETYVTEDGYTFWTPSHCSGLYNSAEATERAARIEIPWLRGQNSN
jgi:hypothetical protein